MLAAAATDRAIQLWGLLLMGRTRRGHVVVARSVSLPLTKRPVGWCVGEFLTLIGTFKVSIPTATFATLGVILSAAYALWLYRKVIFGVFDKPSLVGIKDLTLREFIILAPLVVLTILFGFYPKPVLDMSAASVQQVVTNYNTAITAVKAAALAP